MSQYKKESFVMQEQLEVIFQNISCPAIFNQVFSTSLEWHLALELIITAPEVL